MFTVQFDRKVLDEVEATVTNSEFAQYLLSRTADFAAAAFIMQALFDALDEAKEKLNEKI